MVWNIRGYDVFIDEEDYERLKGFKYYIKRKPFENQGLYYFERHVWVGRKYTTSSLHRDIMGCTNGDGNAVDHKDGTLDCRKSNLRICTQAENNRNQKIRKDSVSGIKGVYWHKQSSRWRAEIQINKKSKTLGNFRDIKDAEKAYAEASVKYHGEFGRTK